MNTATAALVAALGVGACSAVDPTLGGDDAGRADTAVPPAPELVTVVAPERLRAGSPVAVHARGIADGEVPSLRIAIGAAPFVTAARSLEPLVFGFPEQAIPALGGQPDDVTLTLVSPTGQASEPLSVRWRADGPLVVTLEPLDEQRAWWNGRLVLATDGVLLDGEGESRARITGVLSTVGGGSRDVDATLPATPVDPMSRARAEVTLSPSLGGVARGRFDGALTLESVAVDGDVAQATVPLSLRFEAPEVYSVDPPSASIGALLRVRGAGFVGSEDDEAVGAVTVLHLDGTFTGAAGPAAGSLELVPQVVDGSLATVTIPGEVRDGRLVAAWVGAEQGSFVGTVAPEVIGPDDADTGEAAPLRFTIAPVVQVVELRYLSGFDDSVVAFGLGSAVTEVRAEVVSRLRSLFDHVRVDFRTEPVEDFAPGYHAVVEIGGADPNGLGLLGYDNTPGKDVGNLRLGDRIGGANAHTQLDGYPGYGGVFVENFLYWSASPGLPGAAPPGAPAPDPLFDEVFGPVRARSATLDEVRGVGDGTRVQAVAAAIRALAWLIAETTAHELGHSLGLARPTESAGAYHNAVDGPGCLMDAGPDRPFGERAGLPGFDASHFCEASASYLRSILGTD